MTLREDVVIAQYADARLIRLLAINRLGGLTAGQIVERFGVSLATAKRDKRAMKELIRKYGK